MCVLVLVLAGCGRTQDPATEAAAVPPQAFPPQALAPSFVTLASAEQDTVRFRITAPRNRRLLLENCNGAISWGLVRERSGTWVPAWGSEIDGCHSAPLEIAAGSQRDFRETLSIRPGEPLPPGPYRLAVYGLYFTHDATDHSANIEVPHAFGMSEPFTAAALDTHATP